MIEKLGKLIRNFFYRFYLKNFINNIAFIVKREDNGNFYCSKIDNSYITRVGQEDYFWKFYKKGITKQFQNDENKSGCATNIAFNPTTKKWYGWSHRAMRGFTINSKCQKGDCHYQPSNENDFIANTLQFYGNVKTWNMQVDKYGNFILELVFNNNKDKQKNQLSCSIEIPKKYGKGEWIAKTMEDAKLMAKDFVEGVS